MSRAELKTGIYRLSNPIRGDFKGIEFPNGSKVFVMQQRTVHGVSRTLIEGVIDGEMKQDLLKDPVSILAIVMTYIPCSADLSNESIRLKELLRKD